MTNPQQTALESPHQLQLDSRARLHMTGVIEVESFDETTIVLTTTRGTLIVRGEGLHLQLLRLDGGEVLVDGTVDSLSYEDAVPAGGFFARLFGLWSFRSDFRQDSFCLPQALARCLRAFMTFCAHSEGQSNALAFWRMRCLRWRFCCRCWRLHSTRGAGSSGCSIFRRCCSAEVSIF